MSSRKDKFNLLNKKYMNFAINLAKNHKALTGLNPSVGCVVVKNKEIISYGATSINGRPHAETVALNKNKKENSGSVIYLTLEPCSHYGKTPPCTKSIIKFKIKKLYYSSDDFDRRSYKKSKKILKSKGIKVKSGLLIKETKKLYKSYNYIKQNNYPYITGKLACSSNFYILKNNSFITNIHSRNVSHLLRYENHGILTTYKTVNNDNPKLNCRLNGLEKYSPTRIIIDKDLRIKINSYIVNSSNKINTFVIYNKKNKKKINHLKKKGIKLISLDVGVDGYFNLKKLFKKIFLLGVHRLIVECGKDLTFKILSESFFNEFYLFKGDQSINHKNKISIKNIVKKLNKSYKNKKYVKTYLDKDNLIQYY